MFKFYSTKMNRKGNQMLQNIPEALPFPSPAASAAEFNKSIDSTSGYNSRCVQE